MLRLACFWGPTVAYMAAIYWVSDQPNPMPQLTSAAPDKLLHFVEYGALGLLLARALSLHLGRAFLPTALIAALFASLYGASDEVHQLYTPNRSSDVLDWLFDTGGGLLGAFGYVALAIKLFGKGLGARGEAR